MNSFSIFISIALPITTVAEVRSKFEELNLGTIDKIDTTEYEGRDGRPLRKFWIHYSTWSSEESASRLRSRLAANDLRQKQGVPVASNDVPRIVYGTRHNGSDMYWHIYACKTPSERQLEFDTRKVSQPKVRIELGDA